MSRTLVALLSFVLIVSAWVVAPARPTAEPKPGVGRPADTSRQSAPRSMRRSIPGLQAAIDGAAAGRGSYQAPGRDVS